MQRKRFLALPISSVEQYFNTMQVPSNKMSSSILIRRGSFNLAHTYASTGGKVVFGVTAKGKRGIPYVAKGEVSVETSAEKEWGNTATGLCRARTLRLSRRPSPCGTACSYRAGLWRTIWLSRTSSGGKSRSLMPGVRRGLLLLMASFDNASASNWHATNETKVL